MTQRETKFDIYKVERNHDPESHPFSQAHEYQRALIASKINSIFAKPFLYSLNHHNDSINCFSQPKNFFGRLLSGDYDGNIILWDLIGRRPYLNIQAFKSKVNGCVISQDSSFFIAIGENNLAKLYNVNSSLQL